MKIAHILWAPKIGGAELFAVRLAAEQSIVHEVVVLYLGVGDDEIIAMDTNSGRTVGFSCRNGYDVIGFSRLIKHLRLKNYDVIHHHQSPSVLPFVRLGARNALIVKHEHGRSSVFTRSLRQRIIGCLVRGFVDIYIANSDYTKRKIFELEGVSEKKTTVVCGGVDLVSFDVDENRDLIRSEFCLGDEPLILFVGRLVWEKGVDDFLLVAELIHRSLPESRYLVVGDGPLRETVERSIERMNLSGIVTLIGFRDDVPRIMKASDLFLMTSRQEAQGLTVLEAMAAGLPTISFDIGGIPEIIADAGILVKDRSNQMMASSAIDVLTNSELKQALVWKGREHVRKYAYSEVSSKILNIYSAECRS